MSDLPDNQQNSNRAFEPDSMSADAHPDDAATPADVHREGPSETTEAFPSGFHEEPDGQQGQPAPFKTSAATSPDLTNFLAVTAIYTFIKFVKSKKLMLMIYLLTILCTTLGTFIIFL